MRQIEAYPLWLGNVGDMRDVQELFRLSIAAVVDLAVNESPARLPRDLIYCRFPLVDGADNPRWLLRAASETVANLLRAGVPTLVYCGAGMSRTPAIAAAGLALATGAKPSEMLARIGDAGVADVSPALWADIQAAIG